MKRTSSVKLRRKEAGTWLKGLRGQAGLTQTELAGRLGFKYYPFISQVENGHGRVPTGKMEAWAQTLGVDPSHFAKKLISFYEPELHRLLSALPALGFRRNRTPRSATLPARPSPRTDSILGISRLDVTKKIEPAMAEPVAVLSAFGPQLASLR